MVLFLFADSTLNTTLPESMIGEAATVLQNLQSVLYNGAESTSLWSQRAAASVLAVSSSWWSDLVREEDLATIIMAVVIPTIVVTLLFALRYIVTHIKHPKLFYESSRFWEEIIPQCDGLSKRFWPTYWLSDGHLQTMFSALYNLAPDVSYTRELLRVTPTDDRMYPGEIGLDYVDVDFYPSATTPVVIVFHGLTGGSHERYVKVVVNELVSRLKYRCVVYNARGCGGLELKTPQPYCASYTEDVRQAVKHIASKFPKAKLYGIGYSLGSNILVKYLGEEGDQCLLDGAISVANPFDLNRSMERLQTGCMGRNLYSRLMTKGLVSLMDDKYFPLMPDDSGIDITSARSSKSIRDFDDRVTRVIFGYDSVEDYYTDGSSARYIENVRIPLMCINALDDPISDPGSIPVDATSKNPYIMIVTTDTGGHSMDWFEGTLTCVPRSWSARLCCSFFSALRTSLRDDPTLLGSLTQLAPHTHTTKEDTLSESEQSSVPPATPTIIRTPSFNSTPGLAHGLTPESQSSWSSNMLYKSPVLTALRREALRARGDSHAGMVARKLALGDMTTKTLQVESHASMRQPGAADGAATQMGEEELSHRLDAWMKCLDDIEETVSHRETLSASLSVVQRNMAELQRQVRDLIERYSTMDSTRSATIEQGRASLGTMQTQLQKAMTQLVQHDHDNQKFVDH
jgi:uncharacterized protein